MKLVCWFIHLIMLLHGVDFHKFSLVRCSIIHIMVAFLRILTVELTYIRKEIHVQFYACSVVCMFMFVQ